MYSILFLISFLFGILARVNFPQYRWVLVLGHKCWGLSSKGTRLVQFGSTSSREIETQRTPVALTIIVRQERTSFELQVYPSCLPARLPVWLLFYTYIHSYIYINVNVNRCQESNIRQVKQKEVAVVLETVSFTLPPSTSLNSCIYT